MNLNKFMDAVGVERENQDSRFGQQNYAPEVWLAILTEEVGEVATAIQEMRLFGQTATQTGYLNELVQVAAVAIAMCESFERQELKLEKPV